MTPGEARARSSAPPFAQWLEESRRWSEAELERLLAEPAGRPPRLHEALRYAVFGGGKRVRPALVRLVCEHQGGLPEHARAPAAAIELVHTYSLVHDDLPCMDDDDLRRGRPTCHVVHGEAMAVLVGDALQALAFEALSGEPRGAELVRVLARAAGGAGMVGGQVLDIDAEAGARPPALEAVAAIHAKKTGALFSAAAELGALAAGCELGVRARAAAFGAALGLAFQAIDDVLDVTGDAATLGKTPGKDAELEKSTLVAALGLAGARREAERLARAARLAAEALGCREGDALLELTRFVLAREA